MTSFEANAETREGQAMFEELLRPGEDDGDLARARVSGALDALGAELIAHLDFEGSAAPARRSGG